MNRLQKTIKDRLDRKQKCFVAYLTAGDPYLAETPAMVAALVKGGADIIELGIPFSDPLADGPTNQRAAERALAHGATLSGILDLVPAIRRLCPDTPLVVFSYMNPIYAMGFEKFARRAQEVSADAALVVDLPPEESDSYRELLHRHGIDTIFLASPTSDKERLQIVDSKSSGFVYYVSRTGVTGAQNELSDSLAQEMRVLRQSVRNPVMVGFGISTPEQAVEAARHGDGIIIGSAIVRLGELAKSPEGRIESLQAFAQGIRAALDKTSF